MKLAANFLALTTERRGLVFEQAAAGLAGQAVILEKDFWVSWLLGQLFAQPELAPFLVFKGGTSLSKVFGVIDRFSEDIDLCLVPEFVGADAQGFDALTSRAKRDAAVLEMQRGNPCLTVPATTPANSPCNPPISSLRAQRGNPCLTVPTTIPTSSPCNPSSIFWPVNRVARFMSA